MRNSENIREKINQLASERVLILDGAMGSLISSYEQPVKGYNDLLCLTMPQLISEIHEAYLKAGADIIETCSFNAASIFLEDESRSEQAYMVSKASAELARRAADRFSAAEKPRFVAGSIGPTGKSASISSDMNDLSKRAVNWDELEAAYYENARGLFDGGADLIIIETVFDTLNAKAAIFAVKRLANERGLDIPLIVSATLTEGGRLLSGQTAEAFCVSVQHADPLALGLNCSFGAEKLKPHIAVISKAAPCLVIAYPNAGLPNNQGIYEENPESMAGHIEEYLREGLVNIVGGCCGSTPAHISAITGAAKNYSPRPLASVIWPSVQRPGSQKKSQLAGLEVVEFCQDAFLNAAAENNEAKKREFLELIKEGDYDGAVSLLCDGIEDEAVCVNIYMDESLPDAKAAMTDFINFALQYPGITRRPVMLSSSRWDLMEAGLKCLQGKALVNSISLMEGEAEFLRRARIARSYGAAVVVRLADEEGLAVSEERRLAVAARSRELLVNSRFPPEDIIFDPGVSL